MRHQDLVKESVVGSESAVRDMIQTILMSLTARGISDIPTEKIAHILRKRMSIDVPYATIMNVLNTMPIVSDASTSEAELYTDGDTGDAEESSKEQVAQMAMKGATAEKKI